MEDVTEEVIDVVQNYIRTVLPQVVESTEKRTNEQLDDIQRSYLFSQRHVSDPKNFMFVHGERVVIKKISDHVKNEKSANPNKFKMAKPSKKFMPRNLRNTTIGLIFGDADELKFSKRQTIEDIDKSMMQTSLINSVDKLINKYKPIFPLKDVPEVSENMFKISLSNRGTVVAKVQCVFCAKFVKVSSKQRKSSCSWVLSNLKRHFETICSKNTNTKSNDQVLNHDETEYSLLGLEIQPVINDKSDDRPTNAFTSYVDSLRTQLKLQSVKMVSSAIGNGEMKKTCEIKLGSKASCIEICETSKDGNCLFSAICHQINYLKIESTQHKLATSKLRMDAVAQIKENISLYEHDIEGRVSGQSSETYINFLDEFLASDGFWGGSESLRAIAVMMEMNIIIFNEKGEVYFGNHFDQHYKRAIMIAYRITDRKKNDLSNSNRNHYDSVTKVSDKDILKTAKILMENAFKFHSVETKNVVIDDID